MKFVTHDEATQQTAEYVTVKDEKILRSLMTEAKKAGRMAVNTETTSWLPMEGDAVGISFCLTEGRAYYVPFGHVTGDAADLFPARVEGQLTQEQVIGIMRPVLEDEGIKKYGHNVKYDIIVLKNLGVEMRGVSFDAMVGSYLLNPGRANHSLENVCLEYLSHKKMTIAEVIGTGMKQIPFSQVEIEAATRYAAERADMAFRLAGILMDRLKAEDLWKLFEEMELPLIFVLAEMEINGIYVDRDYLREMSKELEQGLDGLIKKIYALAGEEFNINSPKQLAVILFDKLGLKPLRKTKSGFSTDEEVLTSLAVGHELPAEILNYREIYKLKSTYVDALQRIINRRTGRVHTSFNQAVAATGRLSSSEPNLQNIPIRGEIGRRIRKAFSAPPGRVLISADYSQVELRILAHLAQDASFIESFRNDEDIHTRTSSEIFNIAPEAVTAEMRRNAKAINFGIIYGLSAFGLSGQIGVHPKEAQKYIDAYFERHSGVKAYIERTLDEVRARGYAVTIFGRKRPIPELNSDNKMTRSLGERLAVNTPIQGSAADLVKVAMINLARRLKAEAPDSKMILQVHDELVVEAPAGDAEKIMAVVKEEMENAVRLDVPVKVDVGSGPDWGEAH